MAFGLVCLTFSVYRPAIDGEFISDDAFYISANHHIQSLNVENLAAILEPGGPPSVLTANYAPVNLLGHALEWHFFESRVRGYHVVNVLLHLVVSGFVFVFLRRTGIDVVAAALGGLFFLVHPANVETVAWIFQLKTILSTGLGLAALLTFARHPLLATTLFALGLLTKISAAFALPVLVAMIWCGRMGTSTSRRSGSWVGAWIAILCVIAIPVWAAIARTTLHHTETYPDIFVQARTILSLAMRYCVMAVSSYGVSAFQQPAPATSVSNPWWIGGAVAFAAVGFRSWILLRRRDPELIHWTLALAAFFPVSQIFPFPYPFADHYLYGILPGLIGGATFLYARCADRFDDVRLGRATAGLLLVVCLVFAVRSHERSGIWVSMMRVSQDAALHYPDGLHANVIESYEAARAGDVKRSADALRRAFEQGQRGFEQVAGNRVYASVKRDPRFRAVLDDMARWWLERERELDEPSIDELLTFSRAYHQLGDLDASIDRLERAAASGAPNLGTVRTELEHRRFQKRLAERQKGAD